MIFLNSRYANSPVTLVTDANNTAHRTVYRRPPFTRGNTAQTEYQWAEGDRIDAVAADLLGDPGLWWYIMDANPLILDPLFIEPGTILQVPRGG